MCSESTVRAIFRAYGHFPSVYQAPTSPLPVHPHRAVQHPRRGKPSTTHETPHHAESRFTQTPEYGHSAAPRGGTFTTPWKDYRAVEGLSHDPTPTTRQTFHRARNTPPRGKPIYGNHGIRPICSTTRWNVYRAMEDQPRRGRITAPWKDYRAMEEPPATKPDRVALWGRSQCHGHAGWMLSGAHCYS